MSRKNRLFLYLTTIIIIVFCGVLFSIKISFALDCITEHQWGNVNISGSGKNLYIQDTNFGFKAGEFRGEPVCPPPYTFDDPYHKPYQIFDIDFNINVTRSNGNTESLPYTIDYESYANLGECNPICEYTICCNESRGINIAATLGEDIACGNIYNVIITARVGLDPGNPNNFEPIEEVFSYDPCPAVVPSCTMSASPNPTGGAGNTTTLRWQSYNTIGMGTCDPDWRPDTHNFPLNSDDLSSDYRWELDVNPLTDTTYMVECRNNSIDYSCSTTVNVCDCNVESGGSPGWYDPPWWGGCDDCNLNSVNKCGSCGPALAYCDGCNWDSSAWDPFRDEFYFGTGPGHKCVGQPCSANNPPDPPTLITPPQSWINYNPNFSSRVSDVDNDNVRSHFNIVGIYPDIYGNYVNSGGLSCYPSDCSTGLSLNEGEYYWQSWGEDEHNLTGNKSPSNSSYNWVGIDKTLPTGTISHLPASPNTSQTVAFSVTASDNLSGVQKIEMYVDNVLIKTCNNLTTCSYTGGPYSAGGHSYYAKITDNAIDAGGQYTNIYTTPTSSFTVTASFTKVNYKVKINNLSGSAFPPTELDYIFYYCNDSRHPVISWKYTDPAGNPQAEYQVLVDNNSTFSSPEDNTGWHSQIINSGERGSYTTSGNFNWDTLYYYKVRTKNSAGQISDWSNTVAP